MSDTKRSLALELEENAEINLQSDEANRYALGTYGLEIYTHQTAILKDKIDGMALEISQRQDRVKLIHEILQSINKLSDENGLDISKQPELTAKLKVAKELGIDLDEGKKKFTTQERDFLKESLHMAAEDFNNENRVQTQKMQVLIQESDRWLMLANSMIKTDERVKKRIIEKMR
jgi:hypothetical protein